MSLFRKNQPAPVAEFGYQDAVDYLRDLEQVDYAKILKVVNTYREADKKVKKILNIKDEPIVDEPLLEDLLIEDEIPAAKPKKKKAAK
jgi:hypothetical protein